MPELSQLIFPSFLAGLLTFLAPCTFPLVPGYLAFISGTSTSTIAHWKSRMIVNAVFFVIGFSTIFILLGILAGSLGRILHMYREILVRVGGILVMMFGFMITGFFTPKVLSKERHVSLPRFFQPRNPINALLLGMTFGLGWTPCVGPVLGIALTFAASSTNLTAGAILLGVFSLGLALPFIAATIVYDWLCQHVMGVSHHLHHITTMGGIFLIGIGFLFLTDSFGIFVSSTFQFLRFIGIAGYEEFLFEYL